MPGIYIETSPIDPWGFAQFHSYLVYRADDGREWVIRGGPRDELTAFFGGPFDFEVNVSIEESGDARGADTPADRKSTELVFGGHSADEIWNLMVEYARVTKATE